MIGPNATAPRHFWIVSLFALLWNSLGAFDYVASQLRVEAYASAFPAAQLALQHGPPGWATSCWAIGVWGALVGSVGLLSLRRWAIGAFAASLAGVAIISLYGIARVSDVRSVGTVALALSAVTWAVAAFLLFYAQAMAQRGVLR